jgi:hypothetical protein
MDGLEPHKSCFQHDPAVGLNRPNRESPCRLSERDVPISSGVRYGRLYSRSVDLRYYAGSRSTGTKPNESLQAVHPITAPTVLRMMSSTSNARYGTPTNAEIVT